MTSLPQLTEEMRKLAREMLEASQDLELLSQRLGSAQFHKGIVGRPALPAEDASGLEGALYVGGHYILVVGDEMVGGADRALPFQVRASTATPEDGTTTRRAPATRGAGCLPSSAGWWPPSSVPGPRGIGRPAS